MLAALLLTAVAPQLASAVIVPVPNFSFESPAGGVGNPNAGAATGWTANGGAPSGGVSYFSFGFPAAAEGTQYHWLNLPGFGGPDPSVTQSNAGSIGAANAGTYTLTVAGGRRDNGATTDGSYVVELLAGGTVIGSQTVNDPFTTYAPGTWNDITAVAVVGPTDPALGQDLSIRLSVFNGTGGSRSQGQFDHVRLTFDPVPPDYVVTLASGALTVSDASGNGESLAISEPVAGSIQFAAAGRVFSVNGGPNLLGSSGALSLAGVTSIAVNAGAGSDSLTVGAFTGAVPSLTLNGGTGDDAVTFEGTLELASNANLDVDLQDDDAPVGADAVTLAAGADVMASGTGAITIRCSRNVTLRVGALLEAMNGDLTVEANRQLSGSTPGDFIGVDLRGALVRAAGTGQVSVSGRGGDGVERQYGVTMDNGGRIVGGTSGTVRVDGSGGTSLGISNMGVRLFDGEITSLGADVQVIGRGGGSPTTPQPFQSGVVVSGAAGRITAGGGGTVTVQGTGGVGTANQNTGIVIQVSGEITSGGGNVHVTGLGGASTGGSLHSGVSAFSSSRITAGGAGTVTVQGTGGPAVGGGAHFGVSLQQSGSITSGGGAVSVTGHGGGLRPTGGINYGVECQTGSFISSGGGDIDVTGTWGAFEPGQEIAAVVLAGSTGISTAASGGDITLNADIMAFLPGSAITTQATGAATLRPLTNGWPIALIGPGWTPGSGLLALLDTEIDVIDAGTIHIGDENSGFIDVAGPITHPPSTGATFANTMSDSRLAAKLRSQGGYAPPQPLTSSGETAVAEEAVAAAGVARVSPVAVEVDGTDGEGLPSRFAMAPLAARPARPASAQAIVSDFHLTSGGDIQLRTVTNRSFDTGGGALRLDPGPGALIRPLAVGADVVASALTIGAGARLDIQILGTTVDTQYLRLDVDGSVDLTGVELALSGSHVPSIGEQFTIVSNGHFATTGEFNGLPEGGYITDFLGSPLAARITYQGGSAPPSVPNFSFESPDGGVGNPNGGAATGWTANGGAGSGGVSYFSFGFPAASEGTQYHWLNLPGFGGPNPSVTQSDPGLVGTAEIGTYTLTVAGGRRDNGATTDGSYVVELLAGGTVIGSQTVNNPFATYAPGTWNDITAVAVVAPGSPAIGQDLSIRLSAFDGTGGARSQGQFDHVRLTFAPLGANDDVVLTVVSPTTDTPVAPALPSVSELHAVRPNPFTNTASLTFALAARSDVDLGVYSVDGRRVRSLARGAHEPGVYSLTWDREAENGTRVSPGMYFVRLTTSQGTFRRSLVVLD